MSVKRFGVVAYGFRSELTHLLEVMKSRSSELVALGIASGARSLGGPPKLRLVSKTRVLFERAGHACTGR